MNYETNRIGEDDVVALPDYTAPPRRRRTIAIIAVLVVVAALIGWYASAQKKKAAAAAAAAGQQVDQMPSVTFVVPGREMVDRMVSATGTLAARREMPVGVAGEGGMVTRVLVEPGQWVGAGQVLATIDRSVQTQTAASLAAQVTVARSDQQIAQSELDRAQALVDRGFIAKADLQRKAATRDAAAARVQVAAASLAEARARNGRLDIRAPAAGLVLTRGVEPGQIVSSGSGMLFRIAAGGQMELRAALSESDLAGVRPGARATVTPVGTTTAYPGQVWQVSPVIDPTSRQGIARVAVAYNPQLRPGGFAQASIAAGAAAEPLLPESAVQSDPRGNYVYVLDAANKAVRRDVKVGEVTDAGVSVVDGLAGTERVVMSAGAFLTPGQKVKPVRQKMAS